MTQRYAKRTEDQKRGLCWLVGSKKQQERMATGKSLANNDAEIARLNRAFTDAAAREARWKAEDLQREREERRLEMGLA